MDIAVVRESDLNSVLALETLQKIKHRVAKVAIIGLGYVGLPLASTVSKQGFPVLGFDIDAGRVEKINEGRQILPHLDATALTQALHEGRFAATTDFARLAEADVVIICVPTPLTRYREPDLTYIVKTSETIAKTLRGGQLITLESTTYPGTTTDVVRPILEATGLKSGVDFFLAFSPEREDPGNPNFETSTIPKVVGGDGWDARVLANEFYAAVVQKTVAVSSTATAEAVKLTENIFRAVNIALVNELKVIYEAMGVDIWEVIDGAKTKPFGFMPFYPGPGLGGHCIPIDPFYLTWKAREHHIPTRFIELAGEINMAMPIRVVDRIAMALDSKGRRGLNGSRVLVLGLAYKKNIDDLRESPSLRIIELLEARGVQASYHDPHIAEVPSLREHPTLIGRRSAPLIAEEISAYDAVLIATDHDAVDYALLTKHAKLVIDTRNVCARQGLSLQNVVKA